MRNSTAKLQRLQDGWTVIAGRLIGTHAHEVMSIVQHLMSHCDVEAGSTDKPVQVSSHYNYHILTPMFMLHTLPVNLQSLLNPEPKSFNQAYKHWSLVPMLQLLVSTCLCRGAPPLWQWTLGNLPLCPVIAA